MRYLEAASKRRPQGRTEQFERVSGRVLIERIATPSWFSASHGCSKRAATSRATYHMGTLGTGRLAESRGSQASIPGTRVPVASTPLGHRAADQGLPKPVGSRAPASPVRQHVGHRRVATRPGAAGRWRAVVA